MTEHFLNSDWTNYPPYFHKTYKVIEVDKDMHDVTLVCDDGAVDAHKLILSTGSLFFRRVMMKSKHDQPLIYLRGLKIKQLQNLLDFIYFGQVSIDQDNLEEFCITAEEFEIQGIKQTKGETPSKDVPGNVTDDQVVNNTQTDMQILQFENETKHEDLSAIHDSDQEDTVEATEIFDLICDERKKEPVQLEDIVKNTNAVVCTPEISRHIKSEPNTSDIITCKMEPNVIQGMPSHDQSQLQKNESLIKLGASYASMEEVGDAINRLSDTHLCRFVCSQNRVGKRVSIPDKRSVVYKCCFGSGRKSESRGIRQRTSRYVGCPAEVRVQQQNDGALMVVKCVLEHKEHEVSKEAYAKMKRKLSNDQEEAVTALLETNPSNAELAEFLSDLTGKHYSAKEATFIKNRLAIKNKPAEYVKKLLHLNEEKRMKILSIYD